MDLSEKLELFSRTVENRFVFSLFDLLLCGVIVLVIVRGWRAQRKIVPSSKDQLLLLLAFCSLGSAFAVEAAASGSFLFLRTRLPAVLFNVLFHGFQTSAWLLLAASAYRRRPGGRSNDDTFRRTAQPALVLVAPVWLQLAGPVTGVPGGLSRVLDWTNVFLLLLAWLLYYRHPLGRRRLATAAIAFLFVAALLHMGSASTLGATPSGALWNLEQFAWSVSLFVFALAIGESSQDLFDRVFVRLIGPSANESL